MEFNETINQGVFDVYVGLIVSGYDIANPDRVGAILNALMTENWSHQILQYFELARINDGRVNPYWPRASILASVSLLVEQLPVATHLDLIRAYLTAMDNLSPADVDNMIVQWAADLPTQTTALRTYRTYTKAWECYQQIIQREINNNGIRYQKEILTAQGRLQVLLPQHFSSPKFITVLNPLQADPLTDIVRVRDRIYVVTSHLHSESCIHELIHILVDPWLRTWKEQISTSKNLLDLVYDRMVHLTYAWDRSAASWSNVFSETLVRVLTVFAFHDNSEGQLSQISDLVEHGFVYALPIAETIATMSKEQSLSDQWLERCLWACAQLARQEQGT